MLATRTMGAISTSNDGTTSLSKMGSPRLTAVCVLRIRQGPDGYIGPARESVRDRDVIAISLSSRHCPNLNGRVRTHTDAELSI